MESLLVGDADATGRRETGLSDGRVAGARQLLVVVLEGWKLADRVLVGNGRCRAGLGCVEGAVAGQAAGVQTWVILGGAHVNISCFGASLELELRLGGDSRDGFVQGILQILDSLEIRLGGSEEPIKMGLFYSFLFLGWLTIPQNTAFGHTKE